MTAISTNAQPGCCSLKNIKDQKKLSVNCTTNKIIAVCFTALLASAFQIKKTAIPIKIYKAVQTGANIQLGGLNQGLLATAYQPCTPEVVKNPEIPPTSNGINIDRNNFILTKHTNAKKVRPFGTITGL